MRGIEMTSITDVLSLISGVVALVSVIFAWKAVKTAERNNFIALFTELYNIYQSDSTFAATQRVWELYKKIQPNADGTAISDQQALQFVQETDRLSLDWKAVHDASTFWRYVFVLVKGNFIDEEFAFRAFTSPRILGFLYPIEKAFFDYHGQTYMSDESLHWLYDRWEARETTRC
jgi:hypothetical protein